MDPRESTLLHCQRPTREGLENSSALPRKRRPSMMKSCSSNIPKSPLHSLWKKMLKSPFHSSTSSEPPAIGSGWSWLFPLVSSRNGLEMVLSPYYLTTIMNNIGITDSQTQLVINGGLTTFALVTNILFSFFVDRWGRRPINLISTIGMLISFVIWTVLSAIDAQQNNENAAIGKAVVFMIFFYYLWYNLK